MLPMGAVRAGDNATARHDVQSCHACSLRQPATRVLRFASATTRNAKERREAVRPWLPHSLRSLVRPHHRTAPRRWALRPLWLRSARVSQFDSTSGRNAPAVATSRRGERDAHLEQADRPKHPQERRLRRTTPPNGATPSSSDATETARPSSRNTADGSGSGCRMGASTATNSPPSPARTSSATAPPSPAMPKSSLAPPNGNTTGATDKPDPREPVPDTGSAPSPHDPRHRSPTATSPRVGSAARATHRRARTGPLPSPVPRPQSLLKTSRVRSRHGSRFAPHPTHLRCPRRQARACHAVSCANGDRDSPGVVGASVYRTGIRNQAIDITEYRVDRYTADIRPIYGPVAVATVVYAARISVGRYRRRRKPCCYLREVWRVYGRKPTPGEAGP